VVEKIWSFEVLGGFLQNFGSEGDFWNYFSNSRGLIVRFWGCRLISKKSRDFSSKFPRISRITIYFHKRNSRRLGPRLHRQGPIWFIVEHNHGEAARSPVSERVAVGA
jgi:hypothetical protein